MKNKKILSLLLVVLAVITVLGCFSGYAAEPYQTYTYSADGFALYSPAAYSSPTTYTYSDVFTDTDRESKDFKNFDKPTDIFADDAGNVYLADSGNNRIVIMSGEDYKRKAVIDNFDNNGYADSFNECRGVFVDENYVYVCDTNNERIVVFDRYGDFSTCDRVIGKPTGTLFGATTQYNPVAVAVDQYERIFVISYTTFEGVIVMTNEGVFTGYIGAQKGDYSAIEILLRRFQSKAQREASKKNTSTEFNNISIDSDGFIYVTTNTIDPGKQQSAIESKEADYAPIKKLNSAGQEIMKRNGFFAPGGEVDVQERTLDQDKLDRIGASSIVDVAIGDEGTWTIADQKRSKVFTYDQNGVLLFAFGDTGIQQGNIQSISGITYQGERLIILDKEAKSFTVFKRTDYGRLLLNALHCENQRQYEESVDAWLSVLQYNNNFDSAYIGVGRAYYRQGEATFVSADGQVYYKQSSVAQYGGESGKEIVGYAVDGEPLDVNEEYNKTGYDLSMEYLSAAYDAEHWSNAYKEVRKEWIAKFVPLILIAVVAVVILLSKLMKFAGKYNAKVALLGVERKTLAQELMYVFHLVFHPFDGFWDLKHEKRGSIRASLIILVVVIASFYYQSIGTGYVMNPEGEYSTIIAQILSVGLPFILWVISNWCLTTLFEGEGSFKDIFIATSYALAPLPLFLIVSTIASNFVTLEESAIASMLVTVAFVWAGMLIFFGTMVTHDYSFGKNLLMCVATIVGMAVIMFVGFLFSSLIGKMVSFVSSIIMEISYR